MVSKNKALRRLILFLGKSFWLFEL